MKEDFLHYIWRFRLFTRPELYTVSGEKIIVHHPGIYNTNGGPDFLNARITIGSTLWAGHVEIHIRSGDWHRHRHTDDTHYKNVILHVVFEDDREIYLHRPGDLPMLVLSRYLNPEFYARYTSWMSNKQWIPCAPQVENVEPIVLSTWKHRLTTERMEMRSVRIIGKLQKNEGNWPETFYHILARNFGFKVNSEAFEMLAESLPLKLLSRHKSDPFRIEAFLFGQAGMLGGKFAHDYPNSLQKEYEFLRTKYDLHPMNSSAWNFARMRPANFPSLRIAQFSALISHSEQLFTAVLECTSPEEVRTLLQADAHDFWKDHCRFIKANETDKLQGELFSEDRKQKTHPTRLGNNTIENIIINTIAPVLLAYGKHRDENTFVERSLNLLESCKAEENTILKNWKKLGVHAKSAADSQALLQLFNCYCEVKKCLECRIGLYLIQH